MPDRSNPEKNFFLTEDFLVPVIGIVIAVVIFLVMPNFEGQAMNLLAKYMFPLSIAIIALCSRFTKPPETGTSISRYFLKDGKCVLTKYYCTGGCKQCVFASAYLQGIPLEEKISPPPPRKK